MVQNRSNNIIHFFRRETTILMLLYSALEQLTVLKSNLTGICIILSMVKLLKIHKLNLFEGPYQLFKESLGNGLFFAAVICLLYFHVSIWICPNLHLNCISSRGCVHIIKEKGQKSIKTTLPRTSIHNYSKSELNH